MTRTYHLCVDVRGALANWSPKQLMLAFKHIDGRQMSVAEAKTALMDELVKGHEVIPTCACDNFDWKEGCQGHEVPETAK